MKAYIDVLSIKFSPICFSNVSSPALPGRKCQTCLLLPTLTSAGQRAQNFGWVSMHPCIEANNNPCPYNNHDTCCTSAYIDRSMCFFGCYVMVLVPHLHLGNFRLLFIFSICCFLGISLAYLGYSTALICQLIEFIGYSLFRLMNCIFC